MSLMLQKEEQQGKEEQEAQEEQATQEMYRDARFNKEYDGIWKSVGKCVFCDLREKYIFFEENGVVMTVSLYAYIDGHFMIVPRRHIRSIKELTQLEWDTVRRFTYIAKKLIKDVHGIKGMQFVQKDGASAQSTVDQHLHFHCIPFDAPDLTVWNFRKLAYTPLENVALYRQAHKKIVQLDRKYTEKYAQSTSIRIVCDVIILNARNQVLLQERPPAIRLAANYLTLPGGGVDRFDTSLEQELTREIREKIGLEIAADEFTLVDSRIGMSTTRRVEKHTQVSYSVTNRFLWNTYIYRGLQETDLMGLTPGDNYESLIWMDVDKALSHERISPEIRAVLKKAKKAIRGVEA